MDLVRTTYVYTVIYIIQSLNDTYTKFLRPFVEFLRLGHEDKSVEPFNINLPWKIDFSNHVKEYHSEASFWALITEFFLQPYEGDPSAIPS